MKRLSSSLVYKEKQIKTTKYSPTTPIRMVKIEKTTIPSDAEQLQLSYPAGEGVSWYNHFGKLFDGIS